MSMTLFIAKIEPLKVPGSAETLTKRCFLDKNSEPTQTTLGIVHSLLSTINQQSTVSRLDDGTIWICGNEEDHGSVWLRISPNGIIELGEPAA